MGQLKTFKNDPWLSEQLGKNAFTFFGKGFDSKNSELFRDELNYLNGEFDQLFIQAKVPVDSIDLVKLFEENHFNLIDTNVQFRKTLNENLQLSGHENEHEIRVADVSDKDQIKAIAYHNFLYDRFHMDPTISEEVANQLKSAWVGNYFTGERGDNMVVSVTDGVVSGFVQLLEKKDHYIIDLISVDRKFQRRGIASALLTYCDSIYQNLEYAVVGTQIANVHSINLYLKHHYLFHSSQYVFHFNS